MAFVKIPSKIIYGSKSFVDFYYGYGNEDSGNYIFEITGSGYRTFLMTNGFVRFELSGNMGSLGYSSQQYGGEPCFEGSGWKCYFCPSLDKWILMQDAPWYGYIPRTTVNTYYNTDTSAYEYDYRGDLWWESASLNTTPVSGEVAGTFTFGFDASTAARYGLSTEAETTYEITGGIVNAIGELTSGTGPCGTYSNGKYVGYPQWSYTLNDLNQYIVKYGDDKWYGLQYESILYIEDERLDTRWRGYVATEYGFPNLDTNRGWYATLSEPTVGNDITLNFFHWVWDDPEDHDEGGSIVQESSWTDAEGHTFSRPDITASWDDIQDQYSVGVDRTKLLTRIDMGEAAIWR